MFREIMYWFLGMSLALNDNVYRTFLFERNKKDFINIKRNVNEKN